MEPVLTIGHSTRAVDEFTRMLHAHAVSRLVDVRTVPRSRHNPQYNLDSLPGALRSAGIRHAHLPGLGGLRKPRTDSLNLGWRNASFRGYADYMQTPEFGANLEKLIGMARDETVAIMCAEAVHWRCHRSLIADALVVRGISVEHIQNETKRQPHKLTPFAVVEGGNLTYPFALTSESDPLSG
jgi:uncharacterized protein (DUF488 family)